jgi:hypothetical protein
VDGAGVSEADGVNDALVLAAGETVSEAVTEWVAVRLCVCVGHDDGELVAAAVPVPLGVGYGEAPVDMVGDGVGAREPLPDADAVREAEPEDVPVDVGDPVAALVCVALPLGVPAVECVAEVEAAAAAEGVLVDVELAAAAACVNCCFTQ